VRNSGADGALARELERGVSRVAAQVALGGELEAHGQNAPRVATHQLAAGQLRVGQTVRHRALGTNGQIIELCGHDQVRLMMGAIKLLVSTRELDGVPNGAAAPKPVRSKSQNRSATQAKPPATAQRTQLTTLDLRGERVEDALSRVDAFIDRLMSVNESAGFVLHGHGTGALKASVREHLRASAYVEQSRPAESDEGGDAFTVFWVRG
jgi:DNA mismatch repair protein MutS2